MMAADQLRAFLEHGNVRNAVNFPTLELERTGGCRIAVANRNVPGVLGHILSIFADARINVIDMLNKSRENVAYNLIDVEGEPSDAVTQAISRVDGVINVRLVPPPR